MISSMVHSRGWKLYFWSIKGKAIHLHISFSTQWTPHQYLVLRAIFMAFLSSSRKPPYTFSLYWYVFFPSPLNYVLREKVSFSWICCAWLRNQSSLKTAAASTIQILKIPKFHDHFGVLTTLMSCHLLNSPLWCKLKRTHSLQEDFKNYSQ